MDASRDPMIRLAADVDPSARALRKRHDFDTAEVDRALQQHPDNRDLLVAGALFALVGGLEKTGILEKLAHAMAPIFAESMALGATILFWVTIPIVGLVVAVGVTVFLDGRVRGAVLVLIAALGIAGAAIWLARRAAPIDWLLLPARVVSRWLRSDQAPGTTGRIEP